MELIDFNRNFLPDIEFKKIISISSGDKFTEDSISELLIKARMEHAVSFDLGGEHFWVKLPKKPIAQPFTEKELVSFLINNFS